jgi:hypothetical protein
LKRYTVEEIEYGILLGSARKSGSILNAMGAVGGNSDLPDCQHVDETVTGQTIHSLSYFVDAIVEATSEGPGREVFSTGYAQYLEHVLRRFPRQLEALKKGRKPVQAAG